MKRKKGYETPLIEKFRVELEEGICASSVFSSKTENVEATVHETGFDVDFTGTKTEGTTYNDEVSWQ